tara:strand:- start:737 stop:1270 length:534 start_codon:yes stop_codon:yes gene_type:complete
MRVAFVVGHHEKSKGAFSKYFNLFEWDFYKQVLANMGDVSVFYHNENIGGYTSRIKNTASKINKYPFDLVIELHFNASDNDRANGCETLYYYKSSKGKKYAQLFSDVVASETGIKPRNGGLKPLNDKTDRGFASVYYTTAPTILIEPFFGSNSDDCKKIGSTKNLSLIIEKFLSKCN